MKSELPFIRIQNRSLPIDLSTILSLVRKMIWMLLETIRDKEP